jgi:3-oxoacyl-[acyl-carrier protein] reductase
MQLKGKAAIVTGGGTGIGRATSLALGRLGCAVLVNYSRSKSEAEATAREIEGLGVKALAHAADVADDGACRGMVEVAVRAFGRLDILINSAGVTKFLGPAEIDAVTDADWRRILDVNVLGPFLCARAARDAMLAGGGGQIINVSSVAAFSGKASSIPYAASKAALNNLTISLARSLAPQIRVNAVAPGPVTGRWLKEGYGDSYDAAIRAMERKSPLGRVSQPEDVADAIISLLTGSDMITGQVLVCDGGMLIGT